MSQLPCVLLLGCGYVGQQFLYNAKDQGWRLIATSRDAARVEHWHSQGYEAMQMEEPPAILNDSRLSDVTVIIDSIPLARQPIHATQGDWAASLLSRCPRLQHVIYLSSTSVYGDASGEWVDESWHCQPTSIRGQHRLLAEQVWQQLCHNHKIAYSIFRLAGIYGPQRNIHAKLKAGGYRAVRWQPEHYSNRIHVDDVVQALSAAISTVATGVYNISDDLPLPHADYVSQLADCLGAPAPWIISPEEGAVQLSPAMLSFFKDNKRLNNKRFHQDLCAVLRYPNFLTAIESLQ
ncbi:MAG: SDR family oxidoreductase [Mariprofundaceae bacterium]|nr:SDR family oxidoreductase [Mariprofundaceae bacterium]